MLAKLIPDTLYKAWGLLTRRDHMQLVLLLPLLAGAAALEAIGVGTIPAFVLALAAPERVLNAPYVGEVLHWLGLVTPQALLVGLGTAIVAVFLVRSLYLPFVHYWKARLAFRTAERVGSRLFALYMRAPYAFHLTRNMANVIRNTTAEPQRLANQVCQPALLIVLHTMVVAAIATLVVMVQPVLGLLALAMVGVAAWLFLRVLRRRIRQTGLRITQLSRAVLKSVNEGAGALRDARLSGRESYFTGATERQLHARARAQAFQAFANKAAKPMLETIAVLGLFAVTAVLFAQGLSVEEIGAQLALLGAAVVRILPSVNQILGSAVSIRGAHATVDVLHHETSELEQLEAAESKATGPAIGFTRTIALEEVRFDYAGGERPALNGISVEILKGTAVAFVGPTGAGKSTLVDVMLGLLKPTAGRVLVDGIDVRTNLPSWQAQVGYIPQSIYLLDTSIRRNVALAMADDEIDDARVWNALEGAQLADFVRGLSTGLDTIVGDRGVRLSGGQRQRIGIARAIYNEPDVLVLDEATAAVDNITERNLMAAIESARHDRTLIMIAHRLSTVRNCDRIYFIREGRVVDAGTFDELRARNADFRAMAA